MKKTIVILFVLVLWLPGCKSLHKTSPGHTKKIRLEKLLKETEKHRFSAKTMEARITVSYSDEYQSFSGNGKIRMLKDSIIWGSMNFLGIPVVKFYITPEKILYYNKLDQTYYDGHFELLRQKFGLAIDFNNLQNILTGDLITSVNPDKVSLKINRDNYELNLPGQFIKKLLLTPFYKMQSGIFYEPSQGNILLKYKNYQKNGQQNIPGGFEIKTGVKNLKIEYKSVNLDKTLRFPFKIPVGYQKLRM